VPPTRSKIYRLGILPHPRHPIWTNPQSLSTRLAWWNSPPPYFQENIGILASPPCIQPVPQSPIAGKKGQHQTTTPDPTNCLHTPTAKESARSSKEATAMPGLKLAQTSISPGETTSKQANRGEAAYKQVTHSTSTATEKVQYNPYFHRGATSSTKTDDGDNLKKLDKNILLKKGVTRSLIHRYNLRLKVKQSKKEEEEFGALEQAFQKFLDISLQVDPSSTVPPFFKLDHNDKSVPDINSKYQVSELDSMPLLKHYFSCLSNRNNKGNVCFSVILVQNISFQKFMDKARLPLANLS